MPHGPDYDAYIGSPAWAAKRERAFRKHGRACQACGTTELLHVHHHTYDRFRRERLDDLVILCEACHRIVHRLHGQRGERRSLTEVTFAFLQVSNPDAYPSRAKAARAPAPGRAKSALDRSARPARKGSAASMSGKALRARRGTRPGS